MKTLIPLLFASILSACSSTKGIVSETDETNMDGKVVTMYPVTTDCDITECTEIGAQWSASAPKDILLIVKRNESLNKVKGVYLNLDGNVVFLTEITNTRSPSNELLTQPQPAYISFKTSVDTLKSLVGSERAWLRVTTDSNYFDDKIKDNNVRSDAFHSFVRFLKTIES